jgi:hypothetical protein
MRKNLHLLGLLILPVLFHACIKDTDFNQAEQIALEPVVELDLVYFTLDATNFFDPVTQTDTFTVSDTTEIRFLNESGIQEALKRADFYFKFTNSIPRDFFAEFEFLDPQNQLTYQTQTQVLQGSVASPIVTEFVEIVQGDDILQLTQANKVVIKITIPSSAQNLEGALNLQSKATYYVTY